MALQAIKTLDMNRYVCIKTYLYKIILPEISAHHLQCMGGHFFSVPSLHTTVLPYSLIVPLLYVVFVAFTISQKHDSCIGTQANMLHIVKC